MTEPDSNPSAFIRFRALLALLITLLIGAVVIIAMTWFVIGSPGRSVAIPVAEGLTVREFAVLPDNDAYPAALAIAADGTLYTGSYQSGALWLINPNGAVSEIAETRDRIGSVTGLDVAPDGALYILDRISPLDDRGAIVWRYDADGIARLFSLPAEDLRLPDDIAVDKESRIAISDRAGAILRFDDTGKRLADRASDAWRNFCLQTCAPTGLAYDALNHALIVSDSLHNTVARINLGAAEASDDRLLFAAAPDQDYGIDGLTIAPDGTVYLALLNWNRVARLDDGALAMLARDFRGASDLVFDPAGQRLIVTNWNQFSLVSGAQPQLPFALDLIDLAPAAD